MPEMVFIRNASVNSHLPSLAKRHTVDLQELAFVELLLQLQ